MSAAPIYWWKQRLKNKNKKWNERTSIIENYSILNFCHLSVLLCSYYSLPLRQSFRRCTYLLRNAKNFVNSAASDRGKSNCDCKEDLQMPSWAASGCRYESVSSHTGLQYCSQQLNRLLYQVCVFFQIEVPYSVLPHRPPVLQPAAQQAPLSGLCLFSDWRYRTVSSHTGLQYCSQQLNRLLYQVCTFIRVKVSSVVGGSA